MLVKLRTENTTAWLSCRVMPPKTCSPKTHSLTALVTTGSTRGLPESNTSRDPCTTPASATDIGNAKRCVQLPVFAYCLTGMRRKISARTAIRATNIVPRTMGAQATITLTQPSSAQNQSSVDLRFFVGNVVGDGYSLCLRNSFKALSLDGFISLFSSTM